MFGWFGFWSATHRQVDLVGGSNALAFVGQKHLSSFLDKKNMEIRTAGCVSYRYIKITGHYSIKRTIFTGCNIRYDYQKINLRKSNWTDLNYTSINFIIIHRFDSKTRPAVAFCQFIFELNSIKSLHEVSHMDILEIFQKTYINYWRSKVFIFNLAKILKKKIIKISYDCCKFGFVELMKHIGIIYYQK